MDLAVGRPAKWNSEIRQFGKLRYGPPAPDGLNRTLDSRVFAMPGTSVRTLRLARRCHCRRQRLCLGRRFVMMRNKRQETIELETELFRLNALVRQRRQQLARLEKCPNKDCECRVVWHEVVDKNLTGQVRKIRKQVRDGAPGKSKPGRKRVQ